MACRISVSLMLALSFFSMGWAASAARTSRQFQPSMNCTMACETSPRWIIAYSSSGVSGLSRVYTPTLSVPALPSMRPSSQNTCALPTTPSRSSMALRLRKFVPGTTLSVFGRGASCKGRLPYHASPPAPMSASRTTSAINRLIDVFIQGLTQKRSPTRRWPYCVIQPGHTAHADDTVADHHFVGSAYSRGQQTANMDRNTETRRGPQQARPGHACHAAFAQVRREQLAVLHEQQIAHHPANHRAKVIAQQPLENRRIGPFGTREHVLQAVQMLDPGQPGLPCQPQGAPARHNCVRRTGLCIRRQRRRENDPGGRLAWWRRVTACAGAARQHDLDDPLSALGHTADFPMQHGFVGAVQHQCLTVGHQLDVVIAPPHRPSVLRAQGAEHTVAIGPPTITGIDRIGRLTKDEQQTKTRKCHRPRSRMLRVWTLKTKRPSRLISLPVRLQRGTRCGSWIIGMVCPLEQPLMVPSGHTARKASSTATSGSRLDRMRWGAVHRGGQARLKTSEPLVPPNPKLFLSAKSIFMSRAVLAQ